MIFTNWLLDDLLDAYFDAGTPSDPAQSYAALLTAVTDLAAGTVTEASYTGYARIQLSGKLAAVANGLGGRVKVSNAAVTFGQKTDAGSITAIALGIYDALTNGNLMAVVFLDGDDPVPFIGENTGDLITAPGHPFSDDDQARVVAALGASLPTGLSENTSYYVVSTSGETFQLSATQGGAAITLTGDGGGIVIPLTGKAVDQNDTPEFASAAITVGAA